jgi:hypothetical protein
MIDLIIYKAITNPYMRLIRFGDGGIVKAADWTVSATTAWGDSDISLSKDALLGGIQVDISEDLPPGDYDMLIYDNASPSNADTPTFGKRIAWTGKQLMGMPIDLPTVYV